MGETTFWRSSFSQDALPFSTQSDADSRLATLMQESVTWNSSRENAKEKATYILECQHENDCTEPSTSCHPHAVEI